MQTAVIYHGKRSDRIQGVSEIIFSADGVAVRSGQEVTYKSSSWDRIEIEPDRIQPHSPRQMELPFGNQ